MTPTPDAHKIVVTVHLFGGTQRVLVLNRHASVTRMWRHLKRVYGMGWTSEEEAETKAAAEEKVKPIDVACPACNAQPGYPCVIPTDKASRPVGWFHLAREEAAR